MSFDAFDRFKTEYPDQRTVVVISRYWNNPEITVNITREKIELYNNLENFILALSNELDVKPIKLTLKERLTGVYQPSNEGLMHRLLMASVRIVEKTKEVTSKVMI